MCELWQLLFGKLSRLKGAFRGQWLEKWNCWGQVELTVRLFVPTLSTVFASAMEGSRYCLSLFCPH